MIRQGSLVLFKGRLGLVSSCGGGKIVVAVDGEERKLRDKDVFPVHPGPLSKIPAPRQGGDFGTAHAMLVPGETSSGPVSWQDFCELVFGDYSPDAAVACVQAALEESLFRLSGGLPEAISPEEIRRAREKLEKKNREAENRASFIAGLKASLRDRGLAGKDLGSRHPALLAELENFVLGKSERCALAAEAGIAETMEAVHSALIASGLWEDSRNPWPFRAGCAMSRPKLEFPGEELPGRGAERADLLGLESFAIDNAWSTDPDDAISWDGTHVWIHIADPSAYVPVDSALSQEAMERGGTLYLPEKTIRMFPQEAVDILGLGLQSESPALSFRVLVDEEGGIAETLVTPSRVKVTRLDYSGADDALDKGSRPLAELGRIASLRKARRLANGGIDLEFPEVAIRAGKEDIEFMPVPPARSSGIVREMMLLAGEAVARWAYERRLPFIYTSQEAPSVPKPLLAEIGESMGPSLNYQLRKGFKAGINGPECRAHRGLGLSFYSQATSPLRRYQDFLVHCQIRAFLAREAAPAAGGEPIRPILDEDELSRRCMISSRGAAASRQAERDSRLHWTAVFLSRNPGWTGTAIVLESGDSDAWVIIKELGVETGIRTRARPAPDSEVPVKLESVSIPKHDFVFSLA